jgi:outer membrane protein OmpA-like peptidoglycan-associated protein
MNFLSRIKSSLVLFCLLFFVAGITQAQNLTLIRANELYKQFAYKEASELYEQVLKKKPSDGVAMKNLGQCYWKLNDMANTERWYAKIVELPTVQPEDYIFYAMSLETNGKLTEAKTYYEKFKQTANMDKRGERKLKSFEMMPEFLADSVYYKVSPFPYNTADNDFSPTFYQDGLAFVSSGLYDSYVKSKSPWTGEPFFDLFYSRGIASSDTLFVAPVPLSPEINTKYHEGPISLNEDENMLLFSRSSFINGKVTLGADKQNRLAIYAATDKIHGWKKIKSLNINNSDYSVCHPALSADGNTLIFASDMQGGFGGMDLYVSTYEAGKWSDPENLGAVVNTEGNELFPYLYRDSLLYFASNGRPGMGGLDIYAAEWKGKKAKEANNVGYPINTPYDDFGLIYNGTKRTGFFSSNRPGGRGGDDIYRFKNTKPNYKLKIFAFDEASKNPMKKLLIKIMDKEGKLKKEILTDSLGKASYAITKGETYTVMSSEKKYFDQAMPVETKEMVGFDLILDLPMFKDEGFTLVGTINESATGAPMTDVKVVIKDLSKDAIVFEGKTSAAGEFIKSFSNYSINQIMKMELKFEKEGYISKSLAFEKKLERSGDIKVNEILDLKLEKVQLGLDIGKIINLNTIYFDLGKADIRPDAAIELDKVVKAMNDNPNWKVEVGSHTDSRGAANANLTLSDKRAKSTAKYIISKGIDQSRITGKGYGEKKIINKCKDGVKCSDEEHQQNRRTEFKIVGM